MSGVIANAWSLPLLTVTEPAGVIVPCAPAEAWIMCVPWGIAANEADIVWLEITFVKVYEVREPTEEPSMSTSETRYPLLGCMLKVWSAP